ncbi:MAG: SPASM domain-containing protein [Elusimicrobiota bacterium]
MTPASRREFKLRFLLDPAYVVRRLRELRSLEDAASRAADVLRCAFYRFLWDPYFAFNSFARAPLRVVRIHWPRAYYRLLGQENRRFCSRPFRGVHIGEDGEVFACRPEWMSAASIGDLSDQSFASIWNGEKARAARRSILDGSFRHCDSEKCLYLKCADGPVRVIWKLMDEELKAVIDADRTVMPRGPERIECATARSGPREKLEREGLYGAKLLVLGSDADPFASAASGGRLRFLNIAKRGRLRVHVRTDGRGWTPEAWTALPADARAAIVGAEISIDAASPEVYAAARPGASFERLLENLAFIVELRRRGPLEYLEIGMEVRENNFREMPAFVRLGRRLGVDRVRFAKAGGGLEAFAPELERLLSDPVLREPIVFLGNLG